MSFAKPCALCAALLGLVSLLTATAANAQTDYATAQRAAQQGYEAVLQREADPGGFAAATDLIQSEGLSGLQRWLPWLAGTLEFQTRVAGRGPEEIARQVYGIFLNRYPTTYEIGAIARDLQGTGTISNAVYGLVYSGEFAQVVLGL